MELKSYQQEVINDLSTYLEELNKTKNISKAFENLWSNKGISVYSIDDDYLKPYDNSIKGVPRVTVKVPTAGGKTFIACNALKSIFDNMPSEKPKVVAWFVPSDTILQQTYKNLNDSSHPYRQKIDSHFGSAVRVYDKQTLLYGQNFNPVEVKEQLSILVLSIQSFASKTKDGRKVYRENENLVGFTKSDDYNKLIEDADDTALIQVIANLNPVVIIDESHNYESTLRLDLLNLINPSFIFDLTATPREKSNIISYVDAMKLKINNMVKLPVIVYNHRNTNEVIYSAIHFQKKLEQEAIINEQEGGEYIRPIVLFQAQPKNNDDNITFEKIKAELIEIGIPDEQIKIKTSNNDEIKNIDLLSRDCPVRFIITVNALKEGWDCPFAYILASLANRSSSVDVEQILGRILRLPYVTRHKNRLLNSSYVFSSSSDFQRTLLNIIKALNKAGFSKKDYRIKEEQRIEKGEDLTLTFEEILEQPQQITQNKEAEEVEINVEEIKSINERGDLLNIVDEIESFAISEQELSEREELEYAKEENPIPAEIIDKVKKSKLKDIFKEEVKGIKIPSFFYNNEIPSIFEEKGSIIPLNKNYLLNGFDLSVQDKNIDLTLTNTEGVTIDLEDNQGEFIPQYKNMTQSSKEAFVRYIKGLTPEQRKNKTIQSISGIIGKINEIEQSKIKQYVSDIINRLDADKIDEIINDEYSYSQKIKRKIEILTDNFAMKRFYELLDTGKILCEPGFEFPKNIIPKNGVDYIAKNLYSEEDSMNEFEKTVINKVAELDNVVFWHRNLSRGKGFKINGYLNHYADFIIKLKSGKIIVLETKGDHLDNTDSKNKVKLGNTWAIKAGDNYRYYMVFKEKTIDEALTVGELLTRLKEL
ncbi:MAG: DEAD/DEAH box helicase [Bacteroidales bacterium]